jgi:acetyl esterase/lipase
LAYVFVMLENRHTLSTWRVIVKKKLIWIGLFAVLCSSAFAQMKDPVANWTTLAGWDYQVDANIVYKKASGFDQKLDVISAIDKTKPRPTLIYIHGGGWTGGTKEQCDLLVLPYLAKGMNVVNVEYRLGSESLAPAAVEDCRCALRWTYANAKKYGFDINRLVVTGHSAGGHLSLMTGMLTAADGFDNECFEDSEVKVAAIVNFFGITDVLDVLEGPNRQTYAVSWFGSLPNRAELAKKLSPLSYVRKGTPPIITIHGDNDHVVPYPEAIRLQEALNRAGVPNQLVTVPGKGHGGFNHEELVMAQEAIFAFLVRQGILGQP